MCEHSDDLQILLGLSATGHARLCPRQVLGVRMGLLAGKILEIDVPQKDKRLFTFSEINGCGAGGISAATGCSVDRRTMRIMDYGKMAATFVDTQTGKAIRIVPHPTCRDRAVEISPEFKKRWDCQLVGYQRMPDEELMVVEPVQLTVSLEKIISKPGLIAICEKCGEEITNGREVVQDGKILCKPCAGDSYYVSDARSSEKCASWEEYVSDLKLYLNNNHHIIPVVTIIGKSGSGKTTLMEKLIAVLKSRNYRIGTVKHHSHAGFEIDYPGKDSYRHAAAGSQHVIIVAPDKIASYHAIDEKLTLDEIVAEIKDVDIILVEGYRKMDKPSLEVYRSENSTELIGSPEQRFAVAADVPLDLGVPWFSLNDIEGIANLIEQRFLIK
ncbi:MAG: molybdopterin-guanine dinucleotide biosynthesis protein B [Anaerolineales bacterium]|nr:molybdopterin-guanine dinucleotide biosynthesis protein B [Anaerolineales bacterium]